MHPIEQLNVALAGRYVVERELGAGGMATVYLARDLRHDRRVALTLSVVRRDSLFADTYSKAGSAQCGSAP